MSKKGLIIAFTFLIAVIAMSVFSSIKKHQQITRLRNLPVQSLDLNLMNDGDYKGSFCYAHFCYEVNVNISGHKISSILILNNHASKYGKKAEDVINRIIDKQSLQIDVISGATISSKSIIKAVENALLNAQESDK